MHGIDQAALDAATAIMQGPKHINPVREKARIQCIIIDAMKQWNTRHAPEGWQLVPVEATEEMVEESELIGDHAHGLDCDDVCASWDAMLAAAPKWGGE